jgi:hypothetical protein
MYEYLAAVIRPDRSFPQLNDGFILWDAVRLENAAAKSGWHETEFVGSGGTSGSQPHYCSRSFPNAGIHVMRSDWTGLARYLIADTGPYGGPHGHEDKLSFELFAHGASFIVDPGSSTYEKSDPYRNYFVGSQGHNTVLVDGKSQVRRWDTKHMTPTVQDKRHGQWRSCDEYDFASGIYNEGYAPFSLTVPNEVQADIDAVHQRDFVFVKPEYWVLVDYLHATVAHDYQFVFHLAPDVLVESIAESCALVRSDRNGARLIIRAMSSAALSCEMFAGSEDPIQGWYSSDHHVKCPAPALAFEARRATSMCVAWLLYPLAPEVSADSVKACWLDQENREFLKFALNRNEDIDSYSIQCDVGICAGRPDTGKSNIEMSRNGKESLSIGMTGSD